MKRKVLWTKWRHTAAIHKDKDMKAKKNVSIIGIAIAITGALLLVTSHFAGWTNVNAIQITGLALIVVGISAHVALLKHESDY